MVRDLEALATGFVVRDGCQIVWQEFGSGPDCILLLPTWSIVHTDFWRYQVPVLAEQYRVVTFDGLGNGASDRPTDPSFYGDLSFARDAVSVLDDSGVRRAAVAGVSQGGPWALTLAALYPERVTSAVFIAPTVPLAASHPVRAAASARFEDVLASHEGWAKWNRRFWVEHYEEFLQFFFGQCFTEPDSARQIEHFVSMGLETSAEVLLATVEAPDEDRLTPDLAAEFAGRLSCPSLVLHGDQDAISPLGRGTELARLAGSELHVLPGMGHEPQCRSPEVTNKLILSFLNGVKGSWT
ncbi:MAG TPA: alpha/beta hydrolase [Nocardioidaceae bacterium]|nr:alpha/beta hydrolase [Nocardioidaceae bacterium]